MPLHWIYDTNEIAKLVGSGVPEFYKTPSCPYYTYQPGWSTPYGQQELFELQAVVGAGGLDPKAIEAGYYSAYRAGGSAPKAYYQDASTKEFVSNVAAGQHWPTCGGNDNQADAIVHMMLAVALHAGNTTAVLAAAETVIRVTQNTDDAVAFGLAAARILENILAYNMTGVQAVTAAAEELVNPSRDSPFGEDAALAAGLQKVLRELGKPNFDVVQQLGQSCDYPFNLWTGGHLIAQLGAGVNDFVNGTRQTILAGGDSGSRSFFVGACVGAQIGDVTALPSEWTAKSDVFPIAKPLVASLVALRG